MSDFNYEIETTNRYFFKNFTVNGKSVQNGTPSPADPIPVETAGGPSMPPNITWKQGGVSNSTGGEGPDANRIHTAMFEILPGADYTVGVANSAYNYSVRLFRNATFTASSLVYGDQVWKSEDETYNNQDAKYMSIVIRRANNANLTPSDGADTGTFATTDYIGLKADSSITLIDLQGNVLASLPDSTKDILTIDSTGHCEIEKNIGYIASYNGESVGDNYISTTGELSTGASVYYELATPQTIDLGTIDVSNLQDIPEEIPISIVATLNPVTDYSYRNIPTYDVLNPYEDCNAPEYAYPPNHMGQEWETFDANDWNESEMLDYTGQMESHAVYTVELCELMEWGAFDWKRPELDWSEAAYDQEQYERFCSYFEQRFMFREIGMLPPLQWFTALKRMLVYELMPKYKPLYAQVESGINPLGENEYYKERHVSSAYPETLLSGNSDYISSGEDREWERVKINNAAEDLESYKNGFRSVDAALGDELEVLFISMYTSYANGL